ncbi:MAG TPA: hypothetical protein VFF70_03565 [Anaerolineae bacterium]|nr:hypothetical protein [Anaerolineae bacterium]
MMLPKNVLYYGKNEPLPERLALRAGPLSLVYEEGDLRYIQLGEREVLRRVYAAVRDRNWGTILPKFSNVQLDIQSDSFRIAYDVENKQGDIDFVWHGSIMGDTQGTIAFTLDGVARSTFMKNRIGFCVLHPAACAAAACVVEHVDGTIERSKLPVFLVPDQPVLPFAEMRAMTHEVLPGVWAEVRFSGDIFEMEDQRNWTDASYKTLCTPLRLPYPVEIKAGTKVTQSITLRLKDERPVTGDRLSVSVGTSPLTFSLQPDVPAVPLPQIGLGVASHDQPLSERELTRLQALQLHHLRVDLPLSDPACEATLRRASTEASALGIPLEAALFVSKNGEAELRQFLPIIEQVRPTVGLWMIYPTKEIYSGGTPFAEVVTLARKYLENYDLKARWATGTNTDLIWLLRTPPPLELIDAVTFAITPQVHAFDNASVVETLEAQAAAALSARQLAGTRPVIVSPVTFKMRHNPYATGAVPPTPAGQLPTQVDVRQMSLLGAGWTVGSLKYLAESGVSRITYYETTGWRGVMELEGGSPLPNIFRSLPGSVFPLYHVLTDVGEFAGGEVIASRSSDTQRVDGLSVRKADRVCAIVANMCDEPCQVAVQHLGNQVRVRYLDETNVIEAMQAPENFRAQSGEWLPTISGVGEIELLPYAVARIDTVIHSR